MKDRTPPRLPFGQAPVGLVQDRGPAKHFHGRSDVLSLFAQLRSQAQMNRGGTTLLIQGAPGAGKTALLHQCAVEAEKDGWQLARLSAMALYDPVVMTQCLGKPFFMRAVRTTTVDAHVASMARAKEKSGHASVPAVLEAQARKQGTLLVLDEVQTLHLLPESRRHVVAATLNAIHNGEIGQPVILLAGGLGTSEKVFGELGISRFHSDCLIHLGCLSKPAERAVIRDWLVKDGLAKGDVTPWIDAIAAETQGWPQHIICFAQPAATIVRHRNGVLASEGLVEVLQQGRERKESYYVQRIATVEAPMCHALGRLLRRWPGDRELNKVDIIKALSSDGATTDAEAAFEVILHKGVIAQTPLRGYAVPIPSMRDWLIDQYGVQ